MSSRTTSRSADATPLDVPALRAHVDEVFAARASEALTLGVEYELFLISADGGPSTEAETDTFFARVRARRPPDAHGFGARWRTGDDAWSEIKLEHPPHLIELTVGPRLDLHALRRDLDEALVVCEAAAVESGLTLRRGHHLGISAADARVWSEAPLCRDLRAYRHDLCAQASLAPTPAFLNFSATIAAAQLHVGGLAAATLERTVSALYSLEVDLLPFVWDGFDDPARERAARWEGYEQLARLLPLCGYPRLRAWTLEAWLDELLVAPLLSAPPPANPADLWRRARDVQIIRPHAQGTIELRADPALGDLDRLFGILALRVGLVEAARVTPREPGDFVALRRRWWDAASPLPPRSAQLLDVAAHALERRGRGEEPLLQQL